MESFIKEFERPSPKVVEELEPALTDQELHQVMEPFIKEFERPSPKVVEELEPAITYQEPFTKKFERLSRKVSEELGRPLTDQELHVMDHLYGSSDISFSCLSRKVLEELETGLRYQGFWKNLRLDLDILNGTSESKLKLQKDYEDIIKWSKDGMRWDTTKDMYSILREGFLINHGEEWFSVDKDGKNCLMLSARAALDEHKWNWIPHAETRFEEVANYWNLQEFAILCKFRSKVLSPETTYGAYLVYKLPEGYKNAKPPLVQVIDKDSYSKEIHYVLLETPAFGCDAMSEASFNPKLKGLPKQRSDGWMEVQVHEFQTRPNIKMISMRLQLSGYDYDMGLEEITVQCLEFRPACIHSLGRTNLVA